MTRDHLASTHDSNHDNTHAPDRPRFLSEAACHEIAAKLARYARGGGYTVTNIVSSWTANVRWARNQISTSGEVRDNNILVQRCLNGEPNSYFQVNDTSDAGLVAAVRQAERLARLNEERRDYYNLEPQYVPETSLHPELFFERTYQLDAQQRAEAAHRLMRSATDAGMLSAGYIQVSAHSLAYISSWGYSRYFQYTSAQYSVTVRDPKGVGSGWAGVDWPDWSRIDGDTLSALALDKCLKSRNPVAVEPGRYTTILEPQAVCDFVSWLMTHKGTSRSGLLDQDGNEGQSNWPFNKVYSPNYLDSYSKIGERVMDERITISADPMDPDLGFPPFAVGAFVDDYFSPARDFYRPVTWIKNGVLTQLSYSRYFAQKWLGKGEGLPQSGAMRMSVDGPTTSVEEMIATTKRGLLVTRFDGVKMIDLRSFLCQGYTRDGVWLIEGGKISKAVKNFRFTESILSALNNVDQLGVPQRVFHPVVNLEKWEMKIHTWMLPPAPVIVPPLKIKDFSFTALSDAV